MHIYSLIGGPRGKNDVGIFMKIYRYYIQHIIGDIIHHIFTIYSKTKCMRVNDKYVTFRKGLKL